MKKLIIALFLTLLAGCECDPEVPVAPIEDRDPLPVNRGDGDVLRPVDPPPFTILDAGTEDNLPETDAGSDAGEDDPSLDAGTTDSGDLPDSSEDAGEGGEDPWNDDSDAGLDAGEIDPLAEFRCEPGTDKVILCHNERKEVCASENSLDAHLNHGDTLGSCE